MNRIRLAPVCAVTCNDGFEVIDNAAIHIEGDRIVYVGPQASAPPFDAQETIGGEHRVALPGLVNAHTHAAMTLMRGYADDMALEPWLHTKIWPFEANLQADDVYWGTLLAIVEMLRGGTTTFADMYFFYESGAQAVIESGIRACPGGVLLGFLPEAERRIANAIAFARDMRGAADGRIVPTLAPHSLYTCNREQWHAMIEGARANDLMITTHIAETRREVEDVRREWGHTPVRVLQEIGALDGPLLAAHGIYVDDGEFDIIDAHRDARGQSTLRIAHNPTSNLKLASGFAPIPKYLQRGITVALGPDGTASNNDLDMWEEMRLAALLHKATTGDPTAISAQQALLMATREGARALDLDDEIGTLEAGKKADIILVDFDKPHLTPRHNVVSHLVYAAKAADVDTVLIDGKVLLRDGQFTALDAKQISAEATARAQKLAVLDGS